MKQALFLALSSFLFSSSIIAMDSEQLCQDYMAKLSSAEKALVKSDYLTAVRLISLVQDPTNLEKITDGSCRQAIEARALCLNAFIMEASNGPQSAKNLYETILKNQHAEAEIREHTLTRLAQINAAS